jgi:ribosomal protein RSM22 (predicted rRNA methylase)
MQLPAALKTALEEVTKDAGSLRAASDAVSLRYRERGGSLQIQNGAEARAYVATRFPATYAAARRSIDILRAVMPDFRPRRMLDVGAGPGTVACAAREVWELADITLLEPNAHLRTLGQEILKQLSIPAVWAPDPVGRLDNTDEYDLVTAGYVLNELPQADLEKTILKLWSACTGILLLIEPGTPHGSAVIQTARDLLLKSGANLLAPCPQAGACPLRDMKGRWCHFSVRVDRSRLHRHMKDASLSWEDEKFSFVAFGRQAAALPAFRLIGHPSGTKLLRLQVCEAKGKALTLDVPKSDPRHKALRRLTWGDSIK